MFSGVERCRAKNGDDIHNSENKSASRHHDGRTSGRICDKEKIDASVSLNQDKPVGNEIMLDYTRLHANDDGGTSNLRIAPRVGNLVGENRAIDSSSIADGGEKEGRTAKTWLHSCEYTRTRKQKLTYGVKDGRDGLAAADNEGNEERACRRDKERGEQRINAIRKTTPTSLSRKAKSFLRKKSRLPITNSDCTLILPGGRYVKTHGRSKITLSLHGRNASNTTNSTLVKYSASRQDRMDSPAERAGNSLEKPIPLETRELLNKSYWEYYWKLRRKSDQVDPAAAGEREERGSSNEDHLPESQTLRQCSVLSSMINTALRDSAITDGRRSSDPLATRPSNARETACQVSTLSSVFTKKIKRKQTMRANKRLLGFRAIGRIGSLSLERVLFRARHYLVTKSTDRIS